MAYNFPEGSSQQFSSTLAAAKNITVLTNANPAVATSVAHGYTTSDEVLLLSGWEDLNEVVAKVTVLTADTFSIDGVDTTDTNFYPPGTGLGTAQKISGWTVMPQVLTISASGGDPKFTAVNPLGKRNGINIPIGFNPTTVTLTLGHDAGNANYKTMLGISRRLSKTAFKQVLNGGALTYGYGYMAVSEFPKLNSGQVNTVDVAMALTGRSISY